MASFAARFSFVFLALAVLLPAIALAPAARALDANPAPVSQPANAQHAPLSAADTAASDFGAQHCPDKAPSTPQCHAPADHSAAMARIAPRPDSTGAFGALPHAPPIGRAPAGTPAAYGPDLHELSILRT